MNSSSDEDDKAFHFRRSSRAGKGKCSSQPHKPSPKPNNDSTDSKDDKPQKISKGNTNGCKKPAGNVSPSKPLDERSASQISVKKPKLKESSTPVNHKPSNNSMDSDDGDDKPQKISTGNTDGPKRPAGTLSPSPKPLDERSAGQISVKKSKLKDSSIPVNHKPNNDSMDSDDDKPRKILKRNTYRSKKPAGTVSPPPKQLDERPAGQISVKKPKLKESSTPVNHKPNDDSMDSDDDKPRKISKGNTNGSKKPADTVSPTPKPLYERSAGHKTVKKPKLKDSSTPVDQKPVPLKGEIKSDDNDYVIVAHKVKKQAPSASKPLKSKVNQTVSVSRDCQNRNLNLNKRSAGKKVKFSDSVTPVNHKPAPSKTETKSDDNDGCPIAQKVKKLSGCKVLAVKQKVMKKNSSSSRQTKKKSKKVVKTSKYSKPSKVPPDSGEGQKWTSLVHNGVISPHAYKPHGVKMLYKGKPVDLTPEQEEVATVFSGMLDTDYMTDPTFKEDFWGDWRKLLGRNHTIKNLDDCDFKPIYEWHQMEKEKKKQMSMKEKKALKKAKNAKKKAELEDQTFELGDVKIFLERARENLTRAEEKYLQHITSKNHALKRAQEQVAAAQAEAAAAREVAALKDIAISTLEREVAEHKEMIAQLRKERRLVIEESAPRSFAALRQEPDFHEAVVELLEAADLLGQKDDLIAGVASSTLFRDSRHLPGEGGEESSMFS